MMKQVANLDKSWYVLIDYLKSNNVLQNEMRELFVKTFDEYQNKADDSFLYIYQLLIPYCVDNGNVKSLLHSLISKLTPKSVGILIKEIIKQFDNKSLAQKQKQVWTSLIPNIFINPNFNDLDAKLKNEIILFLLRNSFFAQKEDKSFQNVLFKSIEVVSAHSNVDKKNLLVELLKIVLNNLISLNSQSKDNGSKSELLKTIESSLKKVEASSSEFKLIFQVLIPYLSLNLFLEEESIIEGLLKDLQECFKRASNKKQKQSEEELQWQDVLMDILITLISNDSHCNRSIVKNIALKNGSVFSFEQIKQILKVINPSYTDNPDEEDSEEDESSDQDSDDEESNDNDSDEEDEDSAEEDEEASDDKEEPMEAEVSNENDDKEGQSDDSEEEEMLTDEQMFLMEPELIKAFNLARSKSKKEQTKTAKEEMLYKMRCLDVLLAYLKSEPSFECLFQMLEPLMEAAKYGASHNEQMVLTTKVLSVINQIMKVKNDSNESVHEEILQTTFSSLKEMFKKVENKKVSQAIAQALVFIINFVKKNEPNEQFFKELSKFTIEMLNSYKNNNTFNQAPTFISKFLQSETDSKFLLQITALALEDGKYFKKVQLLYCLHSGLQGLKKTLAPTKWKTACIAIGKELKQGMEKAEDEFLKDLLIPYAFLIEQVKLKPLSSSLVTRITELSKPKHKNIKTARNKILKLHASQK